MYRLVYLHRLLRTLRQTPPSDLPPAVIDRAAWWLAWLAQQSWPWQLLRRRLTRQLWRHAHPWSALLELSPPLRGILYELRFARPAGSQHGPIEIS